MAEDPPDLYSVMDELEVDSEEEEFPFKLEDRRKTDQPQNKMSMLDFEEGSFGDKE